MATCLENQKRNYGGDIKGIAKVLDLGCTLSKYESIVNSECDDNNAIESDWIAIGKDFDHFIN